MLEQDVDGILQVAAGMALLRSSRLVRWERKTGMFRRATDSEFENAWKMNVDPIFGRLICWINFSAGAEFFAKGVCLLCGVEFRQVREGRTNFGTMRMLHGPENASLKKLCVKVNATEAQTDTVIKAYKLLASSRNRDAHGYVPNVRAADFTSITGTVVQSFNHLVSWLPINRTVNDCESLASKLIKTDISSYKLTE